MKKHIKKGVTIILMFCLALVTMFSVSAESPEITPFYNNTKSASVFAKVDKDGELTISYLVLYPLYILFTSFYNRY